MKIVSITPELEEVSALARVCVMRAGRIVATLAGEPAPEEPGMAAAFGSERGAGRR